MTFPLASLETDDPIVVKSGEKVEIVSLLLPPFPFLSSPSFLLSHPTGLVQDGSSESVLSCNVSTSHWLSWISLIYLSKTLDFQTSYVVTHDPHGSHLSSCLICSPSNTWLNVSHSTRVKCLILPRCLKKREIPIVSEFDEIQTGS